MTGKSVYEQDSSAASFTPRSDLTSETHSIIKLGSSVPPKRSRFSFSFKKKNKTQKSCPSPVTIDTSLSLSDMSSKATKAGNNNKSTPNRKPYMKATPPPPSTPQDDIANESDLNNFSEDNCVYDSKRIFGTPPLSVGDKLLETVERERKEKITLSVERQGGERAELIKTKRFSRSNESEEEKEEPVVNETTPLINSSSDKQKIFSVEPAFPEHKRSSEDASSSDTLPLKKVCVGEEREDDSTKKEEQKSFILSTIEKLPGWARIAIPALAILTIFTMKNFRRK